MITQWLSELSFGQVICLLVVVTGCVAFLVAAIRGDLD